MELTLDNILLIGSILLFVSLLASRSARFRVPSLVLFLLVGLLAGPEGPGGIVVDNPTVIHFVEVVALCFILFSSGLDTKIFDIKPVLGAGLTLSTLGVILTCAIFGIVANLVFQIPMSQALLLGAIVSSTDASAVFSILRSRTVGLKGRLRPLLELESSSNDPMAFFLTFIFIEINMADAVSFQWIVSTFLRQLCIGALVGVALGFLMQRVFNWIHFDYDGLYSVLMITMVLAVFGLSELLGGNSFLAVFASACTIGNSDFVRKKSLIKQFDGFAWLMQMVLFIAIGLLVKPSSIIEQMPQGILLALIVILLARPIGVFISLLPYKIDFRSKLFVSWFGIRGASPIVFATYPLVVGMSNTENIFVLVFFISLVSVLLQGCTLPYVAKRLNVATPYNRKRKSTLDIEMSWKKKSAFRIVKVKDDYNCIGKELVNLKMPNSIVITMIRRSGQYFVTDGRTKLLANDELFVITDSESDFEDLMHCLTTFE